MLIVQPRHQLLEFNALDAVAAAGADNLNYLRHAAFAVEVGHTHRHRIPLHGITLRAALRLEPEPRRLLRPGAEERLVFRRLGIVFDK